ncbi:hypothetical protein M433DRAFT_158265 [Acidomyces richmondensis BFW]|nr:MAG: hypothetical protein FE78DRAFT_85154 [Acidomyces sp. 'richmondensis']KYG42102.1 hypothetical protein M433DRAFT_158265 [Acidomyces richmondensis BFW]
MPSYPELPEKAAYLAIENSKHRNALSLAVLRDLRNQLYIYNTSPVDGKLRILPPFRPEILDRLETAYRDRTSKAFEEYGWLVDSNAWREHRKGLPSVLVLRSEGPVFCSGHDLGELRRLSYEEVKETFALCAEVMSLIRHSPAPVIGAIHAFATAAGCQLALTTDITVAKADTQFCLPGQSRRMPCTSPSTAVSRKLGVPFTYRMLATADTFRADQLPPGSIDVVQDPEAFEKRVATLVAQIANETSPLPQATGKWAFWTQVGLRGVEKGGDGYEEAVAWTGRVMALHSRTEDAREGMNSFSEKRKPKWKL